MDVKAFEIRDRMTFIPVIAVRLNPADMAERYLISRAGFGDSGNVQKQFVYLIHVERRLAHWDPRSWTNDGTRTMAVAHEHMGREWDQLPSGAVIDVEYILGETAAAKPSERLGDLQARGDAILGHEA